MGAWRDDDRVGILDLGRCGRWRHDNWCRSRGLDDRRLRRRNSLAGSWRGKMPSLLNAGDDLLVPIYLYFALDVLDVDVRGVKADLEGQQQHPAGQLTER